MPDVISAVYNFTSPEVGGSDSTWGGKLNANWTKMESLLVGAFDGGSPTSLGTLKGAAYPTQVPKDLIIAKDGTKMIKFTSAAGLLEAYIQYDGPTKEFFWTLMEQPANTVQARMKFQQGGDILISGNTTSILGQGTNEPQFRVTSLAGAYIQLDPVAKSINLSVAGPILFNVPITVDGAVALKDRVTIAGSGNRTLVFDDENGLEKALMFSNDTTDAFHIRVRVGSTDRSQLVLNTDGSWVQADGYWTGIRFGSTTVATATDVTRHLNLHGNNIGFSVSNGFLNAVLTSSKLRVITDGIAVAVFDALDAAAVTDATVMTRIKGDARYLNASNINSGTIPVANLPITAAENNRVLANMALSTHGEVGMMALLVKEAPNSAIVLGDEYDGSLLVWAGLYGGTSGANIYVASSHPTGTWKALSPAPAASSLNSGGLFIRTA